MRALTTDEFIQKAVFVHKDLYDYSLVSYVNAATLVRIICKKHGEFSQLPYNHLRGNGCYICNKIDGQILGKNLFVDKAIAIHGCKYDYSKVDYINSKTNVIIGCPIHGDFKQMPNKHLCGHGCPLCAPNHIMDTDEFIRKAKVVHGDFYDYSKVVYVDEHTKVCIIDPEFGEFWQQPNSHLNGRGSYARRALLCLETKRTNGTFNTSACAERMYSDLCEYFGVNAVLREYRSDLYPFRCDFYVKRFDLYIELNGHFTHGGHWFDANNQDDLTLLALLRERSVCDKSSGNKRNLYDNFIKVWTIRDLMKRDTAIKNGLNYLVFWNCDLTDFHEWLYHFNDTHVLKQY